MLISRYVLPCNCSMWGEREAVSYSGTGALARKSRLLQRKVFFVKNINLQRDRWHPVYHQAGVNGKS